jgi:hypothetical protein
MAKPGKCQRCGFVPESKSGIAWSRWQRKWACAGCHFKGKPAGFKRYLGIDRERK